MSNPFQGLTGPTYNYTDKYAAIEQCIDWYPTVNESAEEGKFRMTLDQCPGNAPFGPLPVPAPFNQPCRGLATYSTPAVTTGIASGENILVGVNGNAVYLFSWGYSGGPPPLPGVGAYTSYGTLDSSGPGVVRIVVFPSGSVGLFDTSDGNGYSLFYDPVGHSLSLTKLSTLWPSDFFGSRDGTFQDGYALVLSGGTAFPTVANIQMQISGTPAHPLGDPTYWNGANVTELLGQNDPLQAIISSREYVRILGSRRSQVYYNAGANGIGGFPFQSYNSTFIETGISAIASLVDFGDSIGWIGQDARGVRAFWVDAGFQPQRASNFAVEQQWQAYQTISDAIAFTWTWKGETFCQITFPTADKTWVYGKTASQVAGRPMWHERTFNGGARPELFHVYSNPGGTNVPGAAALHLVGSGGADGNPGAIYQVTDSYSDCINNSGTQGTLAQIPVRVTPHLSDSLNRVLVNRVRIDADRPLLMQISRDGGQTYGSTITAQQVGTQPQMSYYNRLGYGRDLVFKFFGDGTANKNSLIAGYIDAQALAS